MGPTWFKYDRSIWAWRWLGIDTSHASNIASRSRKYCEVVLPSDKASTCKFHIPLSIVQGMGKISEKSLSHVSRRALGPVMTWRVLPCAYQYSIVDHGTKIAHESIVAPMSQASRPQPGWVCFAAFQLPTSSVSTLSRLHSHNYRGRRHRSQKRLVISRLLQWGWHRLR